MINIFKKKEKINIDKLEEIENKNNRLADFKELPTIHDVNGQKKVLKNTLDSSLSVYEMTKRIESEILGFQKTKDEILKWFYFYKLFVYSVKKNDNFNASKLNLDKQINKLKRDCEDINRLLRKVKIESNPTKDECNEIYDLICDVKGFMKHIQETLNQYRIDYFDNLKVSALVMAKDKSYDELEQISNEIENLVNEYKGFDRLTDYVEYNSSSLINETIDSFVECMNEVSKTPLNRRYFLDTDFCLHLTANEWITMFSKMIRVYKQISNKANEISQIKLLRLKRKYKELEIRFIIVLIANEITVNN